MNKVVDFSVPPALRQEPHACGDWGFRRGVSRLRFGHKFSSITLLAKRGFFMRNKAQLEGGRPPCETFSTELVGASHLEGGRDRLIDGYGHPITLLAKRGFFMRNKAQLEGDQTFSTELVGASHLEGGRDRLIDGYGHPITLLAKRGFFMRNKAQLEGGSPPCETFSTELVGASHLEGGRDRLIDGYGHPITLLAKRGFFMRNKAHLEGGRDRLIDGYGHPITLLAKRGFFMRNKAQLEGGRDRVMRVFYRKRKVYG